jgi:hypothetical protein
VAEVGSEKRIPPIGSNGSEELRIEGRGIEELGQALVAQTSFCVLEGVVNVLKRNKCAVAKIREGPHGQWCKGIDKGTK